MWVVVQSLWLLCCAAAVWLLVSVTVCSAFNRSLTLLLYARPDWLFVYVDRELQN